MKLTLFTSILLLSFAVRAKDVEILTVKEMEVLISQVSAVYKPIMESRGLSLDLILRKESLIKNAHAEARGSHRSIIVEAGLGRSKYMSEDHFTLILCHELGHHLGGAPFMSGEHSFWASDEGQADYFATKECMRKVLRSEHAPLDLPKSIIDICDSQYPVQEESLHCQRTARAAELFGKRDYLLNHYDQEPEVSYLKPIQLTNALTLQNSFRFSFSEYPDSQCRTDILFQGALCNKDICTSGLGSRPKCWFTNP
jgi:hypothetical protein